MVPLTTTASMIGLIVFCFTLGSIRRTTRPSRWIKPRIGGFSFSSVLRPHAPFSRRRRPARPFLDSRRVAFVPGRYVGLVGFDLAVQHRLGDLDDETFAKMRRPLLDVIIVQAQLLGDLLVRQLQAHD